MAEAATTNWHADGPYIVWEDYGYEGWQPRSFPTLKAAVKDDRFSSDFVITKRVEFDVKEIE